MEDQPRIGRSVVAAGWAFLNANRWRVLALSILLVVPCLWHRHIEAGDLGSHVYNAWLAQLIGKGQAPGLYIARQWNNVLFDVTLLHVANVVGFAAAQKIVVPACVLLFFWGVFAFVAAVSERPPWVLTPAIAMLAYGYSFNAGFFNYYLSIALGCLFLAIVWQPTLTRINDWIAAVAVALLTMFAHPLGICWIAGVLIYRWIRRWLPGPWKLLIPLAELATYRVALWYVHHKKLEVDWHSSVPFYAGNGADQLSIYGDRYVFLVWAALLLSSALFVVEVLKRWHDPSFRNGIVFPVELYVLLICTVGVLPENLHVGLYAAWIGLLSIAFDLRYRHCRLDSFGVRKATLVAFDGLWRNRGHLLRLSVSGHRQAESPRGQCGSPDRRVATRDARGANDRRRPELARGIYRAPGRPSLCRPLFRLFEL